MYVSHQKIILLPLLCGFNGFNTKHTPIKVIAILNHFPAATCKASCFDFVLISFKTTGHKWGIILFLDGFM